MSCKHSSKPHAKAIRSLALAACMALPVFASQIPCRSSPCVSDAKCIRSSGFPMPCSRFVKTISPASKDADSSVKAQVLWLEPDFTTTTAELINTLDSSASVVLEKPSSTTTSSILVTSQSSNLLDNLSSGSAGSNNLVSFWDIQPSTTISSSSASSSSTAFVAPVTNIQISQDIADSSLPSSNSFKNETTQNGANQTYNLSVSTTASTTTEVAAPRSQAVVSATSTFPVSSTLLTTSSSSSNSNNSISIARTTPTLPQMTASAVSSSPSWTDNSSIPVKYDTQFQNSDSSASRTLKPVLSSTDGINSMFTTATTIQTKPIVPVAGKAVLPERTGFDPKPYAIQETQVGFESKNPTVSSRTSGLSTDTIYSSTSSSLATGGGITQPSPVGQILSILSAPANYLSSQSQSESATGQTMTVQNTVSTAASPYSEKKETSYTARPWSNQNRPTGSKWNTSDDIQSAEPWSQTTTVVSGAQKTSRLSSGSCYEAKSPNNYQGHSQRQKSHLAEEVNNWSYEAHQNDHYPNYGYNVAYAQKQQDYDIATNRIKNKVAQALGDAFKKTANCNAPNCNNQNSKTYTTDNLYNRRGSVVREDERTSYHYEPSQDYHSLKREKSDQKSTKNVC